MVYYLLYKSDLFIQDNDFERDIKIIVFGTIIYVLTKYILSSILGFGGNSAIIRFLYYVAIIDMIYCYFYGNKFKKKKRKKKKDLKKEINGIDNLRQIFEKKGLDVLESLKQKLNMEKNNIFEKNISNNNKFINNEDNNNDYYSINNNSINIEVINTDEKSLESDEQSIQIPIYVSSKKEISVNTTEIDTDTESNYIPIYRSRKKSLKNNNNYN